MSGLTAEDIVKLFEADVKARKRLAELLVTEPDIRLTIINAVMRDVATKQDLRDLRDEFNGGLEKLGEALKSELRVELEGVKSKLGAFEGRLDGVEARLDGVEKKLEGVGRELSALRERVASVEGALAQTAERIGDMDKSIDALDKRIDALDNRIDELGKRIDYIARVTLVLTGSVIATLLAAIILRLV